MPKKISQISEFNLKMLALLPLVAALWGCGGDDNSNDAGVGNSSISGISPSTYTIGGGITGLTTQGLILVNGTDTATPNAGDSSFVFPTSEPAGDSYAVSVQLQPDNVTCTVSSGSGTVGTANITDIQVNCASSAFTVGGTISGLTSNGLVLVNGTDTTSPLAGAPTFIFPTKLASAASFNVTVFTQPAGQTCVVGNGVGVILTSSVANVVVTCS